MNRAMILPACIAAALHGGLLAIPSSPRPTIVEPDKPESVLWKLPPVPIDEDLPVINVDDPPSNEVNPPPGPVPPQRADYVRPDLPPDVDFTIEAKTLNDIAGVPMCELPSVITCRDGTPGGPISILTLDNKPRALVRTSPRPPRDFHDARAVVAVEFVVGTDGRVTDARILHSTNRTLDETCLREIRRWRFEPGIKARVPVAFRVIQEFVFTQEE